MATLLSKATGNFSAAGTWAVCNATAELDSETSSQLPAIGGTTSSTFTPGNITVDGIALKIALSAATLSGTLTVELTQGGSTVAGTQVTVNQTDIATVAAIGTSAAPNGWVFFKFAAPVTLAGATAYAVKVTASSANTVSFYRDATAGNFSRQLRTTTTQAPASNDKLLINGELTGAGTGNSFTVTMDYTSTTIAPGSVTIGVNGTLTFGTSASTNYILRINGGTTGGVTRGMEVAVGGTLNIGTSGTRIPSTSTAVLEFNVGSNTAFGLEIRGGGTFNIYGATKSTVITTLTATANSGQAVLTVSSTSGWAINDVLVVAPNRRVTTQDEIGTIQSVDSATQVTLTGNLANQHDAGTTPNGHSISAHVGNITRNVKVRGMSTSLGTYVSINASATVTIQYGEFYWMGSAGVGKRGIDVGTTTGSFSITFSAVHDFTLSGILVNCNSTQNNNITVSNNVLYNAGSNCISNTATTNILVFDSNLAVTASIGINLLDVGCTVTNNIVAACSTAGITASESFSTIGTFSGNVCYTCSNGFTFSSTGMGGTVSSCNAFRNTSAGFNQTGAPGNSTSILIFMSCNSWGNTTNGVFTSAGGTAQITGCSIYSETSFAQQFAIGVSNAYLIVDNTTMGLNGSHSTADINIVAASITKSLFRNCLFGSTSEISSQSSIGPGGSIGSQKHDQTAGVHKTFKGGGTISVDTTIYSVASPSIRLTPITATKKLTSDGLRGGFFVPVNSGQTVTFNIYLRKSVVGDGVAYNGNQPRLLVLNNPAIGISDDTVLATADNTANGAFVNFSGTTVSATDDGVMEFIVDCDGTTGWVNADDISFTVT